jgi:hypothetical protein
MMVDYPLTILKSKDETMTNLDASKTSVNSETPQLFWKTALERTQKMNMILFKQALYFIENSRGTSLTAKILLDGETFREFLSLQNAVISRALKQQESLIDGFMDVIGKYKGMKNVNTLSKYVEQEYDIVSQCGNLINKQVTGWTGLLENIQVDYAYWLSQKKEKPEEAFNKSLCSKI